MYTSNKNNKNPFFVIERDEDADPEPIKDIVQTQVQSNLTHLISPFTQLLIEGGKVSSMDYCYHDKSSKSKIYHFKTFDERIFTTIL